MSRLYCSLTDVKRLLRSVVNRESKVRFSEAYRDLKMGSSNRGSITLKGALFSNAHSSHETYTFEFSDSTSFSVIGDVVGYKGEGVIQETFHIEEVFDVLSSSWSGLAEEGDKCYLTTASDISNDDGHDFIVDTTNRINARLESVYGTLESISYYDSTSEDVPGGIDFACIRMTAYEIFNSIHAGSFPDDNSPVNKWLTAAKEVLDFYIAGHGRGPVWKSREALITQLGNEKVGKGVIEIDNLPDATNKRYER